MDLYLHAYESIYGYEPFKFYLRDPAEPQEAQPLLAKSLG